MKLQTTLLLSAVLTVTAGLSRAGDPPRNPFGNGGLPEILKAYDVDGDGKLSEEERQAFIQAVKDGTAPKPERPARPGKPEGGEHPANPWDTDGDGKLSDAEKAAAREAIRAKIEEQRSKRFDELDTNDDGSLSLEEFSAAPGIRAEAAARIFDRLDKDNNDAVSKEEFLAALTRPAGPRPPSGGGDGGTPPTPPVDGGFRR